jgi:magnesium transporter
VFYLSQILGASVRDSSGVEIGRISDLAVSTGEVFPRITSFAFKGPAKTPFMVSWRKYVSNFSQSDGVVLVDKSSDIRFSYLQPDEILLARDLLNKQIVDTQGVRVVRVNDLKLSESGNQLRLMGAEVGARGLLRGLSPHLERVVIAVSKVFKHPLEENLIAWNYIDLVDRDLSQVQLSMTHRRLHELHPADVADILEQLDPQQRARVFEHLDKEQAADTMAEMEDEYQSDLIDDLTEHQASELLANMEPDDAADILGDLPYEKAEKLLWLMGVQDQRRIRALLGYKDQTAGGIMTTEFVSAQGTQTVQEAIAHVRNLGEEFESIHYIYVTDHEGRLQGTVSLRQLVLADSERTLASLANNDLVTVSPDDDQEEVTGIISKYSLLALPVVDDAGKLLGIVTIDDALDVIEEEHEEDLSIAGATNLNPIGTIAESFGWFMRRLTWLIVWVAAVFVVVLADGLSLFSSTLLSMPLVLVIAETVAFSIRQMLIDYDGNENISFRKLVGHDVVVGCIMAIIALLIGSGFISVLSTRSILVSDINHVIWLATLPAAITIFILIAFSSLIASIVIHHHKRTNNAPSDLLLALFMMVMSVIFQFGFAYAFTFLFR